MPIVRFLPSGKSVTVPTGTGLLETALQADLELNAPCGAKGTCGKCVVKISAGQVETTKAVMLSREAIREGYVQACIATVGSGDATLEIPAMFEKQGQFIDSTLDLKRIDPDRFPKQWEQHPLVALYQIQIPEARSEDGRSDLDRLTEAIQERYGKQKVICSLIPLRQLADSLRAEKGLISLALSQQPDHIEVIRISPGWPEINLYGVAIDLGTTSVSLQLVSLSSQKIITTKTDYNRQLVCGADVISRINYAKRPDRLAELQTKALATINQLLAEATDENGLNSDQIDCAVISGNTTMIHLLLGLNPDYLRLAPYTPTLLQVPELKASDIGLNGNPLAPVYISPAVGSYVGGDITAGLLCTDLPEAEDAISFFLDIGTNGELAIGNRDFIMACACSAGPAFEGGGIACGMRAASGAIDAVTIDNAIGKATVHTIGDSKPKGICGSGIISLIANLFQSGWLDPLGKLDRSRSCPAITINGRQAHYTLVPAKVSGTGKAISISEAEIENVIRAKASIYSACSLLIKQVGIDFSAIDRFYIAGGFGHYLNLEESITIGLLPDIARQSFRFLGNTSLVGSYMLLISRDFQRKQRELAQRITYIDLSNDPGYMEHYTAALFLPHTDRSLFPSIR
jgi:uncharacterized 2Fe-2S/4Fe-4S cluster protein (DUF4445 family)